MKWFVNRGAFNLFEYITLNIVCAIGVVGSVIIVAGFIEGFILWLK